MNRTSIAVIINGELLTNKAYLDSQPKAIRDLFAMPVGADRDNAVRTLVDQGYILDAPIARGYMGAAEAMRERILAGYTWVPSAGQAPTAIAPGLHLPGIPDYDPSNPPPGSIKVSSATADYPISSDMVITAQPFTDTNQKALKPNGALADDPDGPGSTWNAAAADASDLDSVYTDGDKLWEKRPSHVSFSFPPVWFRIQ